MKLWMITNGRSWREWGFEGYDMTPKVFVVAETEEKAIAKGCKAFEERRESLLCDLSGEELKNVIKAIDDDGSNEVFIKKVADFYTWATAWVKNLTATEITDGYSGVICDWP